MTQLYSTDTNSYAIMWKQSPDHYHQHWRAVARDLVHGQRGWTNDPTKALVIQGDVNAANAVIREIRSTFGEHQELCIITADPGRLERVMAVEWHVGRDPARAAILGQRLNHPNR